MFRSAWVKPMTLVQKFEANEAVTACLQVTCKSDTYGEYSWFPAGFEIKGLTNHPAESDGQNPWGRDEWLGSIATNEWAHSNNRCKDPNNSGVIISDDGHISFSDGCWLALHVDSDGDNLADVGERIYWCADQKSGIYTYKLNHWGTVEKSSNHS